MTTPATEGIGGTPAADPPEEGSGAPSTADDGAGSFADPPLSPLIEDAPKPGKRGRPRGSKNARRKLKPRERKERKAKATKAAAVLDSELATAAAIAAQDAATDGKPSAPAKSASDDPPAARSAARGAELEAASVLTDDDMVQIVGLGAHVLASFIPENFGGGTLTVEERELLGKAWWAYARPYMAGEGGPLAVAIGATVQVFALRAVAATMAAKSTPSVPVKASNVAAPAASSEAPPIPKGDQVSGKPKGNAQGAARPRGLQPPAETIGRPPVAPDPS